MQRSGQVPIMLEIVWTKSGWQNCGKSAIYEPCMQITSVTLFGVSEGRTSIFVGFLNWILMGSYLLMRERGWGWDTTEFSLDITGNNVCHYIWPLIWSKFQILLASDLIISVVDDLSKMWLTLSGIPWGMEPRYFGQGIACSQTPHWEPTILSNSLELFNKLLALSPPPTLDIMLFVGLFIAFFLDLSLVLGA